MHKFPCREMQLEYLSITTDSGCLEVPIQSGGKSLTPESAKIIAELIVDLCREYFNRGGSPIQISRHIRVL